MVNSQETLSLLCKVYYKGRFLEVNEFIVIVSAVWRKLIS